MAVDGVANFDALYVTRRVSRVYGELAEGEIHTLVYLAALLSIYSGRPPSWWGYEFHRVTPAAPFSEAVSEAIGFDVQVGLLKQRHHALSISRLGDRELELWEALPLNARRAPVLAASASAAIHLSLPVVGRSVQQEPQIKRATELSSERRLLTPLGLDALREQFEAVAEVLASQDENFTATAEASLLVVAVVWLEYLRTEFHAGDLGGSAEESAA